MYIDFFLIFSPSAGGSSKEDYMYIVKTFNFSTLNIRSWNLYTQKYNSSLPFKELGNTQARYIYSIFNNIFKRVHFTFWNTE